MKCVACDRDRRIVARGLCANCYERWRKGGTVDYVRPLKSRVCSVEGCQLPAHGQGLCGKHLQRLRRTGTTAEGRPYTHIQRDPATFLTTHDLYPIWREFSRKKNPRPAVPEWRDNFDLFIAQVEPRPGLRFRIYGVDREQPIGPGNYVWKEASVEKLPGESAQDYARRQKLAHRSMYPESYKDSNLRRVFGDAFGYAEYQKMWNEQKGLCAICVQPETACDKRGKLKMLAVDHDHTTNAIRALLCQACNQMLGNAKDRPDTLRAAANYLEHHSQKGTDK